VASGLWLLYDAAERDIDDDGQETLRGQNGSMA